MLAEISGKPASLQLQLRWDLRRNKQRPFTNTMGIAQLCVTIGESRHARIMRTAVSNVTRAVTRFWSWRASAYPGSPGCQPVVAGIPGGNILGYAISRRHHFPISASCRDLQAGSLRSKYLKRA